MVIGNEPPGLWTKRLGELVFFFLFFYDLRVLLFFSLYHNRGDSYSFLGSLGIGARIAPFRKSKIIYIFIFGSCGSESDEDGPTGESCSVFVSCVTRPSFQGKWSLNFTRTFMFSYVYIIDVFGLSYSVPVCRKLF